MLKKIIIGIGVLGIGLILLVIIAVATNPEAKNSFKEGTDQAKQMVDGKISPTAPSSENSTEKKITDELKSENIDVREVSFNKYNGFANIAINSDNELTATNTVRDAWKALYLPYKDIPEVTRFGVLVYFKDVKVLQIDGTRDQIKNLTAGDLTRTDQLGLQVGTMEYVKPVLQQLQVDGHSDLMSVIKK